jgi:hypothetical protein
VLFNMKYCKVCSEKDRKIFRHDMCRRCYVGWLWENKKEDICCSCGKLKKIRARGMCVACYNEWNRNIKEKGVCLICGNLAIIHSKGKCKGCYHKQQPGRKLLRLIKKYTYCSICGSQPVSFHSFRHNKKPWLRIHRLSQRWDITLSDVLNEIIRCIPLCNRHHKILHHRINWIIKYGIISIRVRNGRILVIPVNPRSKLLYELTR